jgi:predicted TIM-barrel fold metal-dependent hydrolase
MWPLGAFTSAIASRPFPSLAAPVRPPLRIDAHCHLFNGHDLPIYGLLKSVFLEQNVFGVFAIPFALWLAASVEGNSPTYKQENDDLDHLIENPTAIAKQQTPDQVVEYLERGMTKFIEEQTSFGHPKSPVTDHNDAFLLELARRFAPTSTLQERLTKNDLLKLRDDQQYRRELIKRILEYKSQKDTLGFFDEFSEYVSQFCRWVGTATSYHSKLADDLSQKFGENSTDELRIMTPAIVDFGQWPLDDWDLYSDDLRTADQQAVLIQKIALVRRTGRAVHGFIGFDPWRYLQEVKDGAPEDSFTVLKRAIEQRGFVGVKLYPPMGFRPYENAKLSRDDFPEDLVDLCNGRPGHALDDTLWMVYDYCDQNELAIMAHCSDSIGSRPGYALRSAPEFWQPVVHKFRKLRLNLGHFGGIWDFYSKPECQTESKNTQWPVKIGEMMKTYGNLYVDVGDFSGVLDRWDSEKCATKEIFENNLKNLVGNHPQLRSRMMYGSDWMLLDGEPQNERYYQSMRQKFSDLVGTADVDKFLGQNAAAFLGLHSGQKTRKRIDAFYRNNQQQPPDFDRYLVL